MAELQEAAGMGVHAVELTPATLAPVLPDLKLSGQKFRSNGRVRPMRFRVSRPS
jgi:hypothetical protein